MKRALVGLVLVAATACSSTEREVLLVARGVPVVLAVAGDESCIEVVEDEAASSWCFPEDPPAAVWLYIQPVGNGLVIVGQAPDEVAEVILTGERGSQSIVVRETRHGRFFVSTVVQPGDYEVVAERVDGSAYVSGDVAVMGRDASTVLMLTP